MKIIKCLVVDDSTEIINSVTQMLNKYTFIEISSAISYIDAYQRLTQENFDLLILDMQLGQELGIDLIKNIQNLPPTIAISSYFEFATETFKHNQVIDYILKPIDESRLLKSIGRFFVQNNLPLKEDEKTYCFLKVSRKPTRFYFDSIDYIESTGANSIIHYNNKVQKVNESISDIENVLPPSFKRVHKSFIVNLDKITTISSKNIEINTAKIPIGVSYRTKLMSLLKIFNT